MNITVYNDNQKVEILPAYCNWILMDNLRFDSINNTFVEPYLPHHKIGIMHLAGKNNDKIRFNKNYLCDVRTLDNQLAKKSFRYTRKN